MSVGSKVVAPLVAADAERSARPLFYISGLILAGSRPPSARTAAPKRVRSLF